MCIKKKKKKNSLFLAHNFELPKGVSQMYPVTSQTKKICTMVQIKFCMSKMRISAK